MAPVDGDPLPDGKDKTVPAMRTCRMSRPHQSTSAPTLHTPVLPQLPERIRLLVNATYSVQGGVEHMSLNDWRAVEQELKRRLENEHPKY